MFENALRQLNRIELEVVSQMDKLELGLRPSSIELRHNYRKLLLKVRETTGVHDSLGRLVVWPGTEEMKTSKEDVAIQLNRAVVIQALAYIAATQTLRQWRGSLDHADVAPLDDARRLLQTGQLWRERMETGFFRRTMIRLKRWIVGREPMGGADLDSRVDSAMHGQHAVTALSQIRWGGTGCEILEEATRAVDFFAMGVRRLHERRLGYKAFTPLPQFEVLQACARLELVLGVENSSSQVYAAKAVLAAVRVATYLSAAERFWRLGDRQNDLDRTIHEATEELARARRMIGESRRHRWWDLLRRLKRRPAKPPFTVKMSLRQARIAVDEFTKLIRKRRLPYLREGQRLRPKKHKGYRKFLHRWSRTARGPEVMLQRRPMVQRRKVDKLVAAQVPAAPRQAA